MRAQPPTTGSFLTRCLRAAVAVVALAATARGDAFDDYALFAPEAAPALNPTLAPNEVPEVETTQYFEEALTRRDPAQEAQLQALVDAAVAARLAGIPRPRYIPMTDLAPPKGLILLKNDPRRGEFPFAMALGGYMQLRWFEFARDATQWTNSTGRVLPINNINTFNINRFLLSFHGHVVDERLVYNFALFGTTNVGIRSGVVPIGLLGWKFDDAATVGGGVMPVPGTREWLESSPWTTGIDRSMANTFFRPGFSPGVAAIGSLAEKTLHYQAGVFNAIDGGTTGVLRRGTSMAWAGNTWWEPWGPFGIGASDMEHHDDPVIRVGTSGVYAPTYANPIVGNNPEDTIVRLSDGTPLAATGALGANTVVDRFLYKLATVDAAWKWQGVGLFCEYYWRLLDDFSGDGPFDRSSIFDQGGMAYLSWCFVPRTYEVYARSSAVTGPYGTGQEYGGGLNWYLKKTRQARLTFEALHMNRNPAQNFLYPYRAGYTGTAIQTQLMVIF
ncbi:MAG: porin [Planctomycetota bacterium]